MFKLALIIHAMVATTMMGMGVTAVLAADMGTSRMILIAAAAGFALSIPVSLLIAQRIMAMKGGKAGS